MPAVAAVVSELSGTRSFLSPRSQPHSASTPSPPASAADGRGLAAAGLWAVWPGSGMEWSAYSESLYIALAVRASHAVMTDRWLTAGVLTFTAGLGRSTAVALIAALTIAALQTLHRRRENLAGRTLQGRTERRRLPPLGGPADGRRLPCRCLPACLPACCRSAVAARFPASAVTRDQLWPSSPSPVLPLLGCPFTRPGHRLH